MTSSNIDSKLSKQEENFYSQKYTKKSIYKIKADYRDPFLGKFPIKKKKIVNVKQKPISKKKQVPFPNITYNGIVEGGGSKSYTVL